MSKFQVKDPNFEQRVQTSFAKQRILATIGATLKSVQPGEVEIELPFRDDLVQQHGFIHAAVLTAIVDTACGYAALTLMPPEAAVLTIEYKVNFMSPAIGERMIGKGWVTKPGRNVTVCHGDVYAIQEGKEKTVATMLTTMMTIQNETLKD